MLLDLKNVFQGEDESLEVSFKLSLQDTEIDGVYPFKAPLSITALATNRASLVNIVVTADFDYTRPCDRCCEEVTSHMRYEFTHRLVTELNGDNDDESYIEAPDFKLELDELVRADVLLELPNKYLCSPDCKGLCPHCGANLNLAQCGCDARAVDPRLEKLKQLLD